MMYIPTKVDVPTKFHDKIKKAVKENDGKKSVSVKINLNTDGGNDTVLLLTRGQITKLERARLIGKKIMTIRLSPRQVRVNMKHEGGFLGMLIAALSAAIPSIISAATAAAPAVLASVATGAISGAISKAVSGDGLYLHKKGGHGCAKIQPVKGGGVYLTPHPPHPHVQGGHGLYLKHNDRVFENISPKSSWIKEQLPIVELLL